MRMEKIPKLINRTETRERTVLQERVRNCEQKMAVLTGQLVEMYNNDESMQFKLAKDGRIDFVRSATNDTTFDRRRVERLKAEFKKEDNPRLINQKKISDLFEQLVPVILTKFAKDRFIAVRTSEFDDFVNGVDTILYDQKSGRVICSLDEALAYEKERGVSVPSRQKRRSVISKNGEVELRYGIGPAEIGGGVVLKSYHQTTPLCYLAYESEEILSLIEATNPSISETSAKEFKAYCDLVHRLGFSLKEVREYLLEESEIDEGLSGTMREHIEETQAEMRDNYDRFVTILIDESRRCKKEKTGV